MLGVGQGKRARRSGAEARPRAGIGAGIDWAGPTPEEVAAVRRHPNFAAAMQPSMRVPLDLYQGNRLVNLIINDRGRYVLSMSRSICTIRADRTDPNSGLPRAIAGDVCAGERVQPAAPAR